MRKASDTDIEHDEMSEKIEKGKKALSDTVKSVEENYGEAIEKISTLVRKHPIEALAVGFGVGCLVGLILTRR